MPLNLNSLKKAVKKQKRSN